MFYMPLALLREPSLNLGLRGKTRHLRAAKFVIELSCIDAPSVAASSRGLDLEAVAYKA